MSEAYFPPVPKAPAAYTMDWATRLSAVISRLASKANNAADLTLANGTASTVMADARLSAFSALAFMPTTANAAAIQASIYVDTQGQGHATVHHTNTANTDQTFRVGILG